MSTATRRGVCVETFGGWGGLSLGIEQAGFDVQVSLDVEPVNAAVHEYNFGYGRSLVGDMFEDQTASIRRAMPSGEDVDALVMGRTPEDVLGRGERPGGASLDLVSGGPPCQGISQIGRRNPDDPRNRLMDSFIDNGVRLGARYMIMEQVPSLLQPQNAEHLDHLRETLRLGGYSLVEPRILRAVDFGVPQRRERVFLLIHRNDQSAPEYPQATHDDGTDLFLRRTPTVAEAFDGLADADDFEELWRRDWTYAPFPQPTSWYGRVMTGLENDPEDLSYRRISRRDMLSCSQRVEHRPESVAKFLATPPGGSEPVSRRHRLHPDGQSLTLRAGSNAEHGSFTAVVPIHPKGSRQITVREACRLHSVPDWVRLSSTKIWGYRQLGNSVPPLLGRAVAKQIAKAAGIAPTAPVDAIRLGDEDLLHTANPMNGVARAA